MQPPRRPATGSRGESRGLLLACLILTSIIAVNGTHFRYGTISWLPRRCPRNETGTRPYVDEDTRLDNCSPDVTGGVVVQFDVKLAFRRDYTWGAFFGEQWWGGLTSSSGDPLYSKVDTDDKFQKFDGLPLNQFQDQFDDEQWKIIFPSGYSFRHLKIPYSDTTGHQVYGNTIPDLTGRVCEHPYDTGMLPKCPTSTVDQVPTATDPRTGYFIPYNPVIAQAGDNLPNTTLPTNLGASCNCTYEVMMKNGGACPGGCTATCMVNLQPTPSYSGGSTICAPWAYAYGFFSGVEVEGGDPDYSKPLEITLREIDTDTNSKIGNFITGDGRVYQQYPSALAPDGEPWLAYFTGGDRIGRAADQLQNNFGGRFRLEVSVNLECHVRQACWQKSPRATSLPVVPIPYTERNTPSLYDFSFATFRIAAFDPDIDDNVFFFHASNQKYGTHVGHGIPEGTYPNNPSREEYNNARQLILDASCEEEKCPCPSLLNVTSEDGTLTSIKDFCEEYPEWTDANIGNHTAGPPKRLMIDPYTGVVHWQTGKGPFTPDSPDFTLATGGYTKPREWEDPGGSGTPYLWQMTDAVYDGLVYDPNNFKYVRYSDFSDSYTGGLDTTEQLAPGFYNLVLDIRSQSGDRCLDRPITPALECHSLDDILVEASVNGTEINMDDPIRGPFTPKLGLDGLKSSQRGYNSVPLDFLLYLYPSMSMCNNCKLNNTGNSHGVPTYKDGNGTYGKDDFIGTGSCVICGGSSTNASLVEPNDDICVGCLVPSTPSCVPNTRPYWINRDYSIAKDPYTPAPNGFLPSITKPTGDPDVFPAWGNMEVAQIEAFKGSVVEFDLVAADDDECVELWIYDTGLYKGDELGFCNQNVNPNGVNEEACTVLDPDRNGILDEPVSKFVPNTTDSTNMFDMYLGEQKQAYIPNYSGTSKPSVLGEPGKSVRRQFKWPNVENSTWPSTIQEDYDPRPPNSTICFFAFDGYLFSDFRCVRILIRHRQQIYWSDYRTGLDPNNSWNVVQDQVGFNTGSHATVENSTVSAPLTFANQTRLVVNVGDLLEFDVQAKQGSITDAPLDVFISQGVLPEGATMVKDTDYNQDPVRYKFSWRPTKGQECKYQICFLAANVRGTEYPMTVGYGDMVSSLGPKSPSDGVYTPEGNIYAPYIDERCYTIEVTDTAAHVTSGAYIDVSPTGAAAIVSALDSDCGYSVGGWFFPEAGPSTADMALVSFGYESAGALTAAHQLRWVYETSSDDIAVGTDGTPNAVTGVQYRALAFYELGVKKAQTGAIACPPACLSVCLLACDGVWHYFFATVDASKLLTLYLDGAKIDMMTQDSHEFLVPATGSATLAAVPGEVSLPAGSVPTVRLGSDNAGTDFDGWMNDVRIYSRALTAAEVEAQMFATCTNDNARRDSGECLDLGDEGMSAAAKVGLELWLNFNDANNANPLSDQYPAGSGIVHGCTSDPLPPGASFSRYLSCSVTRDQRDQPNWDGAFEYCNDYGSLVGAGTGYYPDLYSGGTQAFLPPCGEYQCYAKAGPTCAATDCVPADFNLGSDLVCSYQCADTDNSFHGVGYNLTSPFPDLQSDANNNPFVSYQDPLANISEVVGDLVELDAPYAPYLGEMTMLNGIVLADQSGKTGRSAAAYAGVSGTASFEYKISPAFDACPAVPVPNVVHADGGQEIVIEGSNFAESKFLRCKFSGMSSMPATVVEYDARGGLRVPTAIRCRAPGGYGAATAAAIDVSNNARNYTDFNIPVYFTESAAYFDGTDLLELDPIGTTWLDGGLSVGMWFDLHQPAGSSSVQLAALEWSSATAVHDHLVITYNSQGSLLSAGPTIDVRSSQEADAIMSTSGDGDGVNVVLGSTGWHYLMLTMSSGGELALFLDGSVVASANATVPPADAKLWLGGRVISDPTTVSSTTLDQYARFVGYMDKVSVFSRDLTLCEMRQWMWGNLTKGYNCPSGQPMSVDKTVYEPYPADLMAQFGFGGLIYSHGARGGATAHLQHTWNPAAMRYDPVAPGDTWEQSVTDGALIAGQLTNGLAGAASVAYGYVAEVGLNATHAPTLKFVTVPFLAPSFNAPRRKVCGNVRMAVSSRSQATTVSGGELAQEGRFAYPDINFLDNSAAGNGGYTGMVASLAEPMPLPNRCEQNHGFLVDAVVPVEGLYLPEPWSPSLTSCVESGVAIYGFGFAKSPWLSCMQGDLDGNMSPTAAHYISPGEVRCTAEATPLPSKYKMGVTNNLFSSIQECSSSPKPEVVETPEMLQTKDASLYFDGATTFAMSSTVSSGLSSTGVTFGAWFMPTRTGADEQEPLLAFTTKCGAVTPLFATTTSDSASPPAAIVVGATYSDGRVCLTSDLPYYSSQDIPAHSELDLPTTWDSSYGLLDTTNSSLCLEAAAGMWHYVEVSVNPKEIVADIASDEPKVSYLASLKVDGEIIGGDDEGSDSSLRVPSLPLDDGVFFIGGIHCPDVATTSSGSSQLTQSGWLGYQNITDFEERFFQGIMDEVRVYEGVNTDIDWLSKAEPSSTLKAYYTFGMNSGDNQRRQTPHCEEFAAGTEPKGCIKGGMYFARAVEEYWTAKPVSLRYDPENLVLFPRPTGYYPVARGDPTRPSVYPDLITHTDPVLGNGQETCHTPTVSDASYAGTSKAHHNLTSDDTSFPVDFSAATKQPYTQGRPDRYSHFLSKSSFLLNFRSGPDMSGAVVDGTIYRNVARGSLPWDGPDYRFMEVPWYAATIEGVENDITSLDGGSSVKVKAYNAAPSKWLSCKFGGLKYKEQSLTLDSNFTRYQSVMATGSFLPDEADTISCPFPGTTDSSDNTTMGSDWLKLPSMASLQLVNPKAMHSELVVFKESALSLGGAIPASTEVAYASENFHHSLRLECSEGLRFDTVLFANYGRPQNRCNKQYVSLCNGTVDEVDCDWSAWKVTKSCDSDRKKPAGFTTGIIKSYCFGKSMCSIPAKDEIFGDPCSGKNKWLAVAYQCSDRWMAKDFAMLSDANAAELGDLLTPAAGGLGEYSFSAWVHPSGGSSRQSILSFGCKTCAKMNRAILQWVPVGDNVGSFYYYDDYINDVAMMAPNGGDLLLAADQWYHITVTINSGNDGALYLSGHHVASFSTASRPAGSGPSGPTFAVGTDFDDNMQPQEFFAGMVDEVRIFKKALSSEEVFSTVYWTVDMGSDLYGELVAYYKFNNMAEETEMMGVDETPNSLHLMFPSSAEDQWDHATMSYNTAGSPTPHVTLAMHGAAWFPATTYAVSADWETAPVGGGLADFELHGVNFVKGLSRVYYGGEDVTASIVDIQDDVITMTVPENCDGGDSTVYVSNVEGGMSIAVAEEAVTQEASVLDLQSGLVCYFPFFGNAMDWSGHGHDAAVVDGADLATNRNGLANHAYYLDDGDVIRVPDCAPVAVSGNSIKTVAMWVKYADLQFPEQCSEYPTFEEEIGFQGCVMEDHAIMTNTWKLVAGVVGDSSTKIFVNGVELVSQTHKVTAYLDLIHRVVLLQEIGGDDFVGVIDDVWIYDRELCSSELMKLYTTQRYAISMDGSGGLSASILSGARMGSPGLKVTLISSKAPGLTSDSVTTEVVVDLPETNSDLINPSSTGALDRFHPDVKVPTASTTDGFSMVVEGSVYAPSSGSYTFAVTCNDQVYCWLKDDSANILFTIASGQKGVTRTMERTATLTAGEWYGLRCAYTKLPNDLNPAANEYGKFGIRWHSTSAQVNGPLSSPYVRTSGAAELVVAAWIHPEETEGRVGVMSLMGDSLAENEMARFGLSIVDGSLSAGFYTGAETAVCNSAYYREVTSWKSAIMADTWQHVVVAYNGKTMTFFVDGRMTDEVTFDTHAYMELSSDVELMVGADASASMFKGQVYSVAMYNKVLDPAEMANWVKSLWECPLDDTEENLILNLALNEGAGMMAKDFSATLDHPTMRLFGDAQLSAAATWVDATCSTLGTHVTTTEYAGQGLVEGLAGQCMVFSVDGYDKCGTKRLSGGDNFTVEVVGPLHLHAEIYELTVGNGIEDMGDGSYLVHFTREISGYYLVYVKLDGVIVPNSEDEEATKTYVHPYITDAISTYMYDEADLLGLDEVHESCAGVPVAYMIQTVDAYKNLRTKSCDTDDIQVSLEGPYSFDANVANLDDGTFRVNYNAEVAGPYQMRVTAAVATTEGVEERPVYHDGGRTCSGWGQSSFGYCTLFDMPEVLLSGDDYPICLTVHECGSLRTYKDSIYASFPDTDDLDLEGPFTMSAWIKPVPETGEASRQYILSKQSDYSGKGYWLAVLPSQVQGIYTLELGIYVGAEDYRVTDELVSLPVDAWSRIGATYDGFVSKLYVNGKMVDEDKFPNELPKFQRRNAQPLKVGKDFSGMIDNVMLLSEAVPEKLLGDPGKCPAIGQGALGDVVAYYRFNEGATRDMSGTLVAATDSWATKDASGKGNDGFVGLFSDETSQNKEMTIRCPAGYVISEVLFANYGSSKGGYGTYQVDECGADNSMNFVESKCLGLQVCKVLAAYTNFGNPCKHGSKTLAVNAICALPAPDAGKASWAIGDPAPHWVGTAAPAVVGCPYEMEDLPESFSSILPNSTCADWDLSHGVAGETEYFMLHLMDMCGYKNRYPQRVDGYITEVDPSVTLLGDAVPHEPVFASGVSVELTYPQDWAVPVVDQCGVGMEPKYPASLVDFMWGGSEAGFDMYCSRYRDLYLGIFTPTSAHADSALALSLVQAGGSVYQELPVDVAPAALDVAASTMCGAAESAPNCESVTCHDIMAVAGVEAMFEFVARDAYGNQQRTWDDLPMLSLVVENGQSAIHTVMQGVEHGVYRFYVIFPHESNFTVSIRSGDMAGCEFTAFVSPPMAHTSVFYGDAPSMRFEHSMVEIDHNLFVFGGVGQDKAYLSDTWMLTTGYQTFAQGFNYRRKVKVEGSANSISATVLQLHVPTAAWMAAGKLQADCSDLLLMTASGQRVNLWVEPHGTPQGCGAQTTTVWIEVPAEQTMLHLYYGNKGFSAYGSPALFPVFEGFEYTGSPLDNGWSMASSQSETCSPLEPGKTGDPTSFSTSEAVAIGGDRSLLVDGFSKLGGSIRMPAAGMGKSFILKGFFYDTMCQGFHFLSPDFDTCSPISNAKSMLPDTKNALGVYTDSRTDQYCHTYPWTKAGVDRSVDWHSFAFVGTNDDLKMYVDGELVSTGLPTDSTNIFIAGGSFVDNMSGSKGYWDNVLMTPSYAGVGVEMEDEEAVFFDEAMVWTQVGMESAPPIRQGHSASVYDGAMYIFGGERSAYQYSDVWIYSPAEDQWQFVAPANSDPALGRSDHSAVVYDGAMYVYGGRSSASEAKADFWAFDFAKGTWTAMPMYPTMAARHGHGATVIGDKMFVYGGNVPSDSVGLSDEIWAFSFTNSSWIKVGPRTDNFAKSHIADPIDAMQFPQVLPESRLSAVLLGRSVSETFYVMGGAGGMSKTSALADVAGFSSVSKQWTMSMSSLDSSLARLDAAGALIDDMWACTYGGLNDGEFLSDMVCIFIGDAGLSM